MTAGLTASKIVILIEHRERKAGLCGPRGASERLAVNQFVIGDWFIAKCSNNGQCVLFLQCVVFVKFVDTLQWTNQKQVLPKTRSMMSPRVNFKCCHFHTQHHSSESKDGQPCYKL